MRTTERGSHPSKPFGTEMTYNHPTDRGIDSLDQRHLMSIILFLHENGPSGKMEIYDAVSRNASMPKRLGALMELNILDSDGDLFSLTEIGRDIAAKLSDIEDRLATDHRP